MSRGEKKLRAMKPRASFVSELVQFSVLVAAIMVAWTCIVEPSSRSVREACGDRLAVLDTLHALECGIANSCDDGVLSEQECSAIHSALHELRDAWSDAGLSPKMLPVLRRASEHSLQLTFAGRDEAAAPRGV